MPPAIPDKISCETEYQLEREIEALRVALDQEETEESWEPQQRALARFKSLVRGGAYKHDSFVQHVKPLCRLISSPMLSERGRLSAVAIDLVSTLASALGKRFDPLMQGLAPTLMRLCQRPNKVVISRTQICITTVIKQTRLPSIIPHLRDAVKDKSPTLRTVASDAAYLCITQIEVERIGNKVSDFEAIIKTTGRDANPEVRKQARAILQEYRERFPERYAIFISPLTPVTRKYLDVKVSVDAPLPPPLKLSGPAFKQAPQVATTVSFPERPPSSASIRSTKANPPSQGFPAESLPPRPHSVAGMRPKAAPFSRSPPMLASNKPVGNPRPLSVNLLNPPTGHLNRVERPKSLFFEPPQRFDAPATTRPVVVPQSASQSGMEIQKLPEAKFDVDRDPMDPRQRQRSISVSRGREDADRALRLLNGAHTSKASTSSGNAEPQPRPLSTAPGSSSSAMRSKSAMSMRRYDEALIRNPRPISVTSDTLEQFKPPESSVVDNIASSTAPRPTSIVLDEGSRPAAPIQLPARTPRAAFERPQVVYLPASEMEQPSAAATTTTGAGTGRTRPQKTWSLSHQLELLNKRKRAEEAKATGDIVTTSVESGVPVDAETGSNVLVDTPVEEVGSRVDRPEIEAAMQIERPVEPEETATTEDDDPQQANRQEERTVIAFPIAEKANTPPKESKAEPIGFPIVDTDDAKPADRRTPLPSEALVVFPASETTTAIEEPALTTSTTVKRHIANKASGSRGDPAASTSNKPPNQSTVNKGPNQPSTRTRTISSASKQSAIPARTRVVSTSSSKDKDAMKMHVRVPSRNASQPSGFVPKRTVKSSITQPTKSQAARAQAVMDEKTATAATRSASDKPSQVSTSTIRKPVATGINARDQQQTSKSKTAEPNQEGQMSVPDTAIEAKPRARDGPRKPAVPTLSSLVKTHAAKREAGLSQVAIRLGLPSTNNNANGKFGTGPPKVKPKVLAAAAPMKKIALSLQERQPFKPRSNPAHAPLSTSTTANSSPKQSIRDVLLSYGEVNKAPVHGANAAGGTGLVSLDSVERKPEMELVAERSDATIPLPSSSFSIGDEMMGITFKRVGDGYDAVPIKSGNGSGGAGVFKELQVS